MAAESGRTMTEIAIYFEFKNYFENHTENRPQKGQTFNLKPNEHKKANLNTQCVNEQMPSFYGMNPFKTHKTNKQTKKTKGNQSNSNSKNTKKSKTAGSRQNAKK